MPPHKGDSTPPQNKDVPELNYRTMSMSLRAVPGAPPTLDEKSRTVEAVIATENPVDEFDFKRWEIVPTVLLMSGMQMPQSRQLPLLECHSRFSTETLLGSLRDLQVEGDQLASVAHFSRAEEAEGPWTKVREGHLTDFSIGRRDLESTFINDGDNGIVAGRNFTGPVRVVTKWIPREASICPIGADELAKVRSPHQNTNTQTTEESNMDPQEKVVDDNTPTRSDPQPPPVPAETPPAAAPAAAAPPREASPAPAETVDLNKIRSEAAGAERKRILEVDSLCDEMNMPDEVRSELITSGISMDEVHRTVVDHMRKKSKAGPGYAPAIEMGKDERDKFRSAATDSLFLRSGILRLEKPAPGAVDLRGFTLREMCREALRMSGQSDRGDPLEMVQRALTTSDLPNILSNVANKFVLTGFETAEETWRRWCSIGSVNDFKQNTLTRASETQDLPEILEHGEYTRDKISDKKEVFTISTFGIIMGLSRQAIINDDLGQLTNIPMKHGEAAARKIGDVAYAILTANANMGDGVALFAAGHSNIGTGGVISEVTAAEGIKLMKQQKDIAGVRRLNITPKFFIAPVALEGSAEIFFTSERFEGATSNTTRGNPYAGSRFERVYEPRLDDNSEVEWFMAGPKGKTAQVFFLAGNETPFTEQRQGFEIDGIEWKVRQDVVAKALDWAALLFNAGA